MANTMNYETITIGGVEYIYNMFELIIDEDGDTAYVGNYETVEQALKAARHHEKKNGNCVGYVAIPRCEINGEYRIAGLPLQKEFDLEGNWTDEEKFNRMLKHVENEIA